MKPKVATKCPDCDKILGSDRMMKIHWAKIHFVRPENNTDKSNQDGKIKASNAVCTKKNRK